MADVRMRGFERRTSLREALQLLDELAVALPAERVGVEQAAGRVAAELVCAAADVPHFRRAMMDGYAVVAESTFGSSPYRPVRLRLAGEVRAGRALTGTAAAAPEGPLAPGHAIAIATGAPLPAGADAVVPAEQARPAREGDGAALAPTHIEVTAAVSPAKHVGEIGEDVKAGSVLVQAGRRLRPQDAGVLASAGIGEVAVVGKPRVRILVTGDEILPPGSRPAGACIVDSNSVVLRALVARDGGLCQPVAYVRDDAATVEQELLAGEADVVLVSGGSSVGPEDHAPSVLARVGRLVVHGVAMRPASPSGFGAIEPGAGRTGRRLVFLLPGHPVSCLCAYEFFAGRAIRALGGRPRDWPHRRVTAPLGTKLVSQLGRTDYVRVELRGGDVHPLATGGASILSSTMRADGAVIVAEELEGYAEGQQVSVLLYD